MTTKGSNNLTDNQEVTVARELCARILKLPESTLALLCRRLTQRHRLLRATGGEYGLFSYFDFYDSLYWTESSHVDVMKDIPYRFRNLRREEGELMREAHVAKSEFKRYRERRNRRPSDEMNRIMRRVHEFRDGERRKKWDQVLLIINREFPVKGKEQHFANEDSLRNIYRKWPNKGGKKMIRNT